ncbi:MAG TPA: aquaporin [Vicinamibacterales bacterium]|nr:aquaporin [Vicinamibacterales bacterium]
MRATPYPHWPEYLIEAVCLAAFMVSAAAFATVLQHPASPLAGVVPTPGMSRVLMGVAMGLTLVAIVQSPWGQRSGAHMNPAVTLTFLRLGRIEPVDAASYIAAQFAGGAAGIAVATVLLARLPAHASVNYVATVPGPAGAAVAFAAEAAISFALMLTVLAVSNHPRLGRLTGIFAGLLVALFIVFESPLSGTSMNPARSAGPAVLARTLDSLWIYFSAPTLGMWLAADVFVRRCGRTGVRCAKLVHPVGGRCIFRCGHAAPVQEVL